MRLLVMIYLSCNQKPFLKRFENGWPQLLLNKKQPPEGGGPMNDLLFDPLQTLFEPVFSLKKYIDGCRAPSLWPYHQMYTMPLR